MGTMDEDFDSLRDHGKNCGVKRRQWARRRRRRRRSGDGKWNGGGEAGEASRYHDCYFDHLLTCPRVIVDALS